MPRPRLTIQTTAAGADGCDDLRPRLPRRARSWRDLDGSGLMLDAPSSSLCGACPWSGRCKAVRAGRPVPRTKVLRRVALGLAACVILLTAGCAESVEAIVTELARRDCRTDTTTRVDGSRAAILFVRSHIYVKDDGLRSTFVDHFTSVIPQVLEDANAYLESKGAGILLASAATTATVSDAMFRVDTTGFGGSPAGASRQVVDEVAVDTPEQVHIHWSPRSTTRVTGYGGPPLGTPETFRTNWIGFIEDPVSGSPRSEQQRMRLLAHELGHYLGLTHNGISGNLMEGSEQPSGDALTAAQVDDMHKVVNGDRTHLVVLSCRRDPVLSQLLRDHTGAELLRASAEPRGPR